MLHNGSRRLSDMGVRLDVLLAVTARRFTSSSLIATELLRSRGPLNRRACNRRAAPPQRGQTVHSRSSAGQVNKCADRLVDPSLFRAQFGQDLGDVHGETLAQPFLILRKQESPAGRAARATLSNPQRVLVLQSALFGEDKILQNLRNRTC